MHFRVLNSRVCHQRYEQTLFPTIDCQHYRQTLCFLAMGHAFSEPIDYEQRRHRRVRYVYRPCSCQLRCAMSVISRRTTSGLGRSLLDRDGVVNRRNAALTSAISQRIVGKELDDFVDQMVDLRNFILRDGLPRHYVFSDLNRARPIDEPVSNGHVSKRTSRIMSASRMPLTYIGRQYENHKNTQMYPMILSKLT